MSETQTEQPVVDPPVPDTPAPADTPATEMADTPEETEQKEAAAEGRRIAQLRARLGAAERERDRQAAELEVYRRQQAQQAPEDDTPEQRYQRERAQIRTEVESQLRAEMFHQQGLQQFPDWKQRCDDLMGMGADAQFASLLVDMPDGAKVAAALASEPDEVQRIAGLRSERARAIALGKFAASIEDAPVRVNGAAAHAPVQVTRAPAPVRPVTGRASPVFNEYTADANALVDKYMRDALQARMKR
jgi:hypothetical protein